MKRFGWLWLVISSGLLMTVPGAAETRPQYGGTLHVTTHTMLTSLDPTDNAQPYSFTRRSLTLLVFETLITTDDGGRLHAALATSWQADYENRRWQVHLRRGIKFHDGTPFTPELAASSLHAANSSWSVSVDSDSVIITCDASDPDLPIELAFQRNAIVKRSPSGSLNGTGPFHIAEWQAGKKLSLAAEDNYWRGRPFVDGIEIEFGKNFHDQIISLELGKADLVEVPAEQSHRVSAETRRVASSTPMELLALLFTRDAQSPEDKSLREALTFSIDRGSIRNVLLQGAGQPAASYLPNWLSGYAFTFPTGADLPRARHDREQVRSVPVWTLGYDGSDPMARLLVERISLNARDAGLKLQPTTSVNSDLRLVRISLMSVNPWISLAEIAILTGQPRPKSSSNSVEDLYRAEQEMLASQRMIPLFHLPATYAATISLKQWATRTDGIWNIEDAWLANQQSGNSKP
jgi:peptide/nickel transport system substrate-binding protein